LTSSRDKPPSTHMLCPVMQLACGEAKNAITAATSSERPRRFLRLTCTYAAATFGPITPRTHGEPRRLSWSLPHACSAWLPPLASCDDTRPEPITQQKVRPRDVHKSGRAEPRAVFTLRVGLAPC